MNSLQKPAAKPKTFTNYLSDGLVKDKINSMLGAERGLKFVAGVVSAVSNNPSLQTCEHSTIVSAALLGETLNLSPSPFLGHYYMVPFDNKDRKVAQFQIGYKGYIQLAIRSGQYRDIDVISIKEGEFVGRDPETGKHIFKFIEDDTEREQRQTIGYLAYFELLNGLKKRVYMSRAAMENHATTYSQAYRRDLEKKSSWSFWSKNFEMMAFKTVLRQLISKWGIMSIELQTALEKDMAVLDNNRTNYVDNNDLDEGSFLITQDEPTTQKAETTDDAVEPKVEKSKKTKPSNESISETNTPPSVNATLVDDRPKQKESIDDLFARYQAQQEQQSPKTTKKYEGEI
jgi:recombination protein RecT